VNSSLSSSLAILKNSNALGSGGIDWGWGMWSLTVESSGQRTSCD
jgi:hypothetical protein